NRESTSILILINMEASITAAEAARRLGVKPATVYAYVSRGVLRRHKDSEGRRSLFDAAQVEELARGGRPRRPPAPAELVIESSITALRTAGRSTAAATCWNSPDPGPSSRRRSG